MKFSRIPIFACAVIFCSTTVQAQDEGAYGVIGVATYEFDNYGLDAKVGYKFSKSFAIEAQGVLGLSSNSTPLNSSVNAATFKRKVDYTLGAFVVGSVPLDEQINIFARGGVHNTRVSAEINNAANSTFNNDEVNVAAGGGVQVDLNSNNALRAEYTYLAGSRLNTISIGYARRF